MRFFPRAVGRRTVTAVSLWGLIVATAIPLASASVSSDDLKDRQSQVKKGIETAHDALEESSRRLGKATQKLDVARVELSGAKEELDAVRTRLEDAQVRDLEMQDELVQASGELDDSKSALVVGSQAVGEQRDAVANLVAGMYTEGDPDLMAISSLLDAESPSDLMRSDEGRRVIVGEQARTYDDLTAAEVLLEVQRKQVADAERAVADKARDAAAHVQVMESLETQTESAKDEVVRLVGARTAASVEAEEAKQADRQTLKNLKKEDARIAAMLVERARQARIRAEKARKRAEAKAAREARAAARAGKAAPAALAAPLTTPGGFLARPVPGAVTSSYGMRVHPIYGYWGLHDGIDFGVACGEPMYAVADGEVISSYYQSAYGNRLIIDHGYQRGVGLATIYNHAANYTVGVGDTVTRGEVVGYVGSTGWSTGCHLHFTVMANGTPVDPMGWL